MPGSRKTTPTKPASGCGSRRRHSGTKSITYPEALEIALCHGWIDGLKRGGKQRAAWLQRFMPRAEAEHVVQDQSRKGVRAHRLAADEAGRTRGDESASKAGWPLGSGVRTSKSAHHDGGFRNELNKNPRAKKFFKTISAANRYAILWRIQTAKKAETGGSEFRSYVEMLEKGETYIR